MTIDRLIEVMPPPQSPVDLGTSIDWASIEQQVGLPLPTDYKEFIATYGTGSICGFLWVFNPFTKNRFLNFAEAIKNFHFARKELSGLSGVPPYPKWPSAGEILPWGVTDNGDELYWRIRGAPNDWSIYVTDSDWAICEDADGPMSSFLVRLLTRELRLDAFSIEFPRDQPYFTAVGNTNGTPRPG